MISIYGSEKSYLLQTEKVVWFEVVWWEENLATAD